MKDRRQKYTTVTSR